jgi:hypothetical protein
MSVRRHLYLLSAVLFSVKDQAAFVFADVLLGSSEEDASGAHIKRIMDENPGHLLQSISARLIDDSRIKEWASAIIEPASVAR